MKKTLAFLFFQTVCVFLAANLFAQEVTFLLNPRGAKAVGFGRAYTAVAEGVGSVPWNSAGLANLDRNEFYFSRLNSFEDISENFVTVAFPFREIGTIGFSVNYQSLGDFVITGPTNPDPIGTESAGSNIVIIGTYATPLTDKIDVGVSYKFIRSRLVDDAGSTSAIDLGALYRPFNKLPLQVGVAFLDIGFDLKIRNQAQADPLPRRFRIGGSYKIIQNEAFRVIAATDVEQSLLQGDETSVFSGTEVSFTTLSFNFALRGGYIRVDGVAVDTGGVFGIGVDFKGYRFDFAREDVSALGSETHIAFGVPF